MASEDYSSYFFEGPPFKQKDWKNVSTYYCAHNNSFIDYYTFILISYKLTVILEIYINVPI